MPFDWNDFLSLAEELLQSDDEASHRTSISRAYYAIFNVAFERADRNCGPMPEEAKGFHKWCWDQYANTNHRDCRRLAVEGRRLRDRRVQADYKRESLDRHQESAADMIVQVTDFQTRLAALDPEFPRRNP